ncbi:MAG: hypothetical protein WAT19_15000 [Ferruginibacter sp.]
MKLFFTYLLLLLFTVSCYTPRYVYSPSAQNVPLLTKKNDSKIAFNYSTNLLGTKEVSGHKTKQKALGYDIQAAWAVSKNWAVQSNYYKRKELNDGSFLFSGGDSTVINYRRSLLEGGIGYYTRINKESNKFFQVFAGLGSGKFSFTDGGRYADSTLYRNFFSSRVTKFYIQPAFIYSKNGIFNSAFSSRFSFLNFHGIRTDYSSNDLENYKLDGLSGRTVVFWEPVFVNSYGFKKIPGLLLEWQAGFSFLMSRRFVDARSINFSAGLLADLGKILKENNRVKKK